MQWHLPLLLITREVAAVPLSRKFCPSEPWNKIHIEMALNIKPFQVSKDISRLDCKDRALKTLQRFNILEGNYRRLSCCKARAISCLAAFDPFRFPQRTTSGLPTLAPSGAATAAQCGGRSPATPSRPPRGRPRPRPRCQTPAGPARRRRPAAAARGAGRGWPRPRPAPEQSVSFRHA